VLRALLFDFNGLLVDDEPLHFRLFQQILAEEGVALAESDYYGRFLGFDDRGCFLGALAEAGRPADPIAVSRLVARKATYYQEEIRASGYPFFPGAVELVRAARAAGLMLGVVSGALRDEVEGALGQRGLGRCFKVLVTAEDVARGKPDPEGYRLALARLNAEPPLPERLVHPHEVLALEDSPAGLDAAAAAGLRTLGVAHTYPRTELARAERVVDAVGELTVARLCALYDAV
jgi:HAD superfamily hydrolase (TIGR01509 family)